jgi:hypothetical protein
MQEENPETMKHRAVRVGHPLDFASGRSAMLGNANRWAQASQIKRLNRTSNY